MGERTGTALFPRAQAPIPQLDEFLKSGLQVLKPETIRGGLDVTAIPALHHRLDATAGLPGRPRRAPAEKHVVFRLELLQLRLERLQLALGF